MVSDTNVKLKFLFDMSDAKNEAKSFERQVRQVGSLWRETRMEIMRGVRDTGRIMYASVGVYQNVLRVFGVTLRAQEQAIIGAIEVSIAGAIKIAAVLSSASLGMAAAAEAILAGTAIAIAWAQVPIVIARFNEFDAKLNEVQSLILSLQMQINTISGY